jgi:hypothetical protein
MSEGQRQNRKNRLVAAIAVVKFIAEWPRENNVSRRTGLLHERSEESAGPSRNAAPCSLVDACSRNLKRGVFGGGWLSRLAAATIAES